MQEWRINKEVERATLEWVWWFNKSRLRSELDFQLPAEYATKYYDSEDAITPTGALVKH